jgi:hypothetical protein
MNSESKRRNHLIKQYIVSNIDNSSYEEKPRVDTRDKLQFLYDTFMSEYGWRVEQVGLTNALKDYFQGLPSSCTVAFYNDEILFLGKKWNLLAVNDTEKAQDNFLNNWFNMIANKTSQLFRHYKIAR